LVTNGDFSDGAAGWSDSANATLSVSGGYGLVTTSAASNGSSQTISGLTIGAMYRLQGNLKNGANAANTDLRIVTTGGALVSNLRVSSSVDTFVSGYFFATDTQHLIRLLVNASTYPANSFFDNISVREVTALELSIAMRGRMTGGTMTPARWYLNADNAILQQINTSDFTFTQEAATVVDSVTGGAFTSGINVPFSIASRHGSTFINGAVDGTALTADLTPTSLPNLSATNLSLAFSGGPMIIEQFTMWDVDLADAGIEEASA